MKVKVYELAQYLGSKVGTQSRIVRFSSIAIVECKSGIVILDDECCGEIIKEEGLGFVLRIPYINSDFVCMSDNGVPTIDITLQEIIDNCKCEKKELKDFVYNPYKMRIQDNMKEAQRAIRKLNKVDSEIARDAEGTIKKGMRVKVYDGDFIGWTEGNLVRPLGDDRWTIYTNEKYSLDRHIKARYTEMKKDGCGYVVIGDEHYETNTFGAK